jgi:hypothetical protein
MNYLITSAQTFVSSVSFSQWMLSYSARLPHLPQIFSEMPKIELLVPIVKGSFGDGLSPNAAIF